MSTFTAEGRFLTSAGERGFHRRAGEFNSPRGVAVGETEAVFLLPTVILSSQLSVAVFVYCLWCLYSFYYTIPHLFEQYRAV